MLSFIGIHFTHPLIGVPRPNQSVATYALNHELEIRTNKNNGPVLNSFKCLAPRAPVLIIKTTGAATGHGQSRTADMLLSKPLHNKPPEICINMLCIFYSIKNLHFKYSIRDHRKCTHILTVNSRT